MDLVPMTFSIEKYVELEVDVMVHKDMLTESKRRWKHSNADIPDEVRDHIIEQDSWRGEDYSTMIGASKCYGGDIDYILTKDGLVPLESLPDLKDEDLSWGEDRGYSSPLTSSTSEAQI